MSCGRRKPKDLAQLLVMIIFSFHYFALLFNLDLRNFIAISFEDQNNTIVTTEKEEENNQTKHDHQDDHPKEQQRRRNNKTMICRDPLNRRFEEVRGEMISLYKVRQGVQKSRTSILQNNNNNNHNHHHPNRKKQIRLMCIVYTHSKRHSDFLMATVSTWGNECDGFFAGSDLSNSTLHAIQIAHRGPEQYDNMVQKVHAMLLYAYQHYGDQYDFFHVCGDDVYLVVDNMKAYLASDEVTSMGNGYMSNNRTGEMTYQRPILLGSMHFYNDARHIRRHSFCSGGPGYTLNRQALQIIATSPHCNFTDVDSREDLFMSGCLLQRQTFCMNTRDQDGAFRYHDWDAFSQYEFKAGLGAPWSAVSYTLCNIRSIYGLPGISEESVSFHLKRFATGVPAMMRRYHGIIHDMCIDEEEIINNIHKNNASSSSSSPSTTTTTTTTTIRGEADDTYVMKMILRPPPSKKDENGFLGTPGSTNVTYPIQDFPNPNNLDFTKHDVRARNYKLLLDQSCEAWGGKLKM